MTPTTQQQRSTGTKKFFRMSSVSTALPSKITHSNKESAAIDTYNNSGIFVSFCRPNATTAISRSLSDTELFLMRGLKQIKYSPTKRIKTSSSANSKLIATPSTATPRAVCSLPQTPSSSKTDFSTFASAEMEERAIQNQLFLLKVCSASRFRKKPGEKKITPKHGTTFKARWLTKQLLCNEIQNETQARIFHGFRISVFLSGSLRQAYGTSTSSAESGRNSTSPPQSPRQANKNIFTNLLDKNSFQGTIQRRTRVLSQSLHWNLESPSNVPFVLPSF